MNDDKPEPFDQWKVRAEDPWPEEYQIFEAIETCGVDHAEERIAMLQTMVKNHREAAAMGVFNDE